MHTSVRQTSQWHRQAIMRKQMLYDSDQIWIILQYCNQNSQNNAKVKAVLTRAPKPLKVLEIQGLTLSEMTGIVICLIFLLLTHSHCS